MKTIDPIKQQESQRRRTWFRMCGVLGVNEENQRIIADRFIPDSCKSKFDSNGQVSRGALFKNSRYWSAAYAHLRAIETDRRKSHRSLSGKSGNRASSAQISLIISLGRQLAWDEYGDNDMSYRLMKYSARQTGDSDALHPLEFLTPRQASNVIRGLQAIHNHSKK